ncbi:MAG: sulfite exporter TauE/SafE family protein [Magnetospirillum sp.]|nr:sulfite exporter TauE/SafE family protein [Magnetospirillum sp.]
MEHPVHLALVLADGPWALAVALFAAGLAGGFVHCAAMCGPFVMAQTLARMDAGPRRLAGAALAPYHAGRLVSYAALGGVLGGLGGALAAVPGLGAAIPISLASAGILFALQAWGKAFGGQGGAAGAWLGRKVRPLLESPGPGRGFALGLALGLLPCGFLYAALAAAAGAGGAAQGALAMAGFALGTVPSLLVVGFAGAMAAKRWRAALAALAPGLLAINAALLFWMAWRAS